MVSAVDALASRIREIRPASAVQRERRGVSFGSDEPQADGVEAMTRRKGEITVPTFSETGRITCPPGRKGARPKEQ
jgi:hypothetical protein